MRVILIEEKDAKALLARLELERERLLKQFTEPREKNLCGTLHGNFHYVVTRWLQDQGAEGLTR